LDSLQQININDENLNANAHLSMNQRIPSKEGRPEESSDAIARQIENYQMESLMQLQV